MAFKVVETVVMSGYLDEEWGMMAGIMTVIEKKATCDRLDFLLSGP